MVVRRLIILILLIQLYVPAFSQEYSFKEVDSTTYSMYASKDWKGLTGYGRKSIRQGVDYYYLRMRLGLALMERGNYMQASEHFKKATDFNRSGNDVWELRYRSLDLSGKDDLKDAMVKRMPEPVKEKLSLSRKPVIDMAYIEGGALVNNNFEKNGSMDIMGFDKIYGEQLLYGTGLYGHAGVRIRISGNLKLYLGYNFLDTEVKKRFQYTTFSAVPDSTVPETWGYSMYYDFPVENNEKVFNYKVKQDEFYANMSYTMGNGLQIIPAFHWSNLSFKVIQSRYAAETASDTAFYIDQEQIVGWFSYNKPEYTFKEKNVSTNDFLYSLSLNQSFSVFEAGVSAIYSRLDQMEFYQFDGRLYYYPFGNLNFYGLSEVRYFNTEWDDRMIFNQMLGVKIVSWLWAEAAYTHGDLSFSSENYGLTIFSTTDEIRYRISGRLIFPLGEHLTLNFRYQLLERNGIYMEARSAGPGTYGKKEFTYQQQNIIGGLQWNF